MLWGLFRKKKPCDHKKNYVATNYLLADGTPMSRSKCYDCNWDDHGHVYGDSEGWEGHIRIIDGKVETATGCFASGAGMATTRGTSAA